MAELPPIPSTEKLTHRWTILSATVNHLERLLEMPTSLPANVEAALGQAKSELHAKERLLALSYLQEEEDRKGYIQGGAVLCLAAVLAGGLSGCYLDSSAIGAIDAAIRPTTHPPIAESAAIPIKVTTKVETEILVGGVPTIAPSQPARMLAFKGTIQARPDTAPMVGVSKLTGCMGIDGRVADFMSRVGLDPIPLLATARPDMDGRYSLTIQDAAEPCLALFLICFGDRNGDGAFSAKREFTAGVYTYLRKAQDVTFTFGLNQPASPAAADFEVFF